MKPDLKAQLKTDRQVPNPLESHPTDGGVTNRSMYVFQLRSSVEKQRERIRELEARLNQINQVQNASSVNIIVDNNNNNNASSSTGPIDNTSITETSATSPTTNNHNGRAGVVLAVVGYILPKVFGLVKGWISKS